MKNENNSSKQAILAKFEELANLLRSSDYNSLALLVNGMVKVFEDAEPDERQQ